MGNSESLLLHHLVLIGLVSPFCHLSISILTPQFSSIFSSCSLPCPGVHVDAWLLAGLKLQQVISAV